MGKRNRSGLRNRKTKKRKINREKEEKVGESSNQEKVSGDPLEDFEHEVFLSFRGVDTRTNFTDHLYSYLTDVRIRTFRDKENLYVGKKIGPKLIEAIERSKILIPIFSKGYASSEWCLMELTHMVKRVEIDDRVLICPIFYDVTPSEVRKQTGSFKDAFDIHMKKFDKKTVAEWKEALKTVTYLKGWEKDKIADGYESNLVLQVVTKVLMELKKKHVEVTEHLVGMDQHEAELMQLLDLDCNDVKIVGIFGMGGIGKTTIAKFIYNKLCDRFSPHCSILENVREKVNQSAGLHDLKKQLMKDILSRTSDGVEMNPRTFRNTKALIVLDDVDDRSQLEKIIGGCNWFGHGSRIIVTTRNSYTFREQEGEKIFEPAVLNSENALRLFCKHAFRQDCPMEGYIDLSRKVESKVAGLPLSLEVIGSLLYTKKRELWDVILNKLEQRTRKKVQERLRISYDMLDYDGHKEIFLDIACHFINSDKDEMLAASYMWEGCGFVPKSGIDVLVTLSLVKIDKNGRFTMHDELRHLGWEIARKKNRRLWSYEVARDVLTSKRGTELVRTLSLHSWEDDLSNEEFRGLSGLRYLDLSDMWSRGNLTGDFEGIFSNLIWFRWSPQSPITVTNFCLPKLVVLDLSRSNISDGWDDLIQIKRATNLKVLDLSGCLSLTKTPYLSAFSKLERLNLKECRKLVEISPSLGHLQHLKYLNLNLCGDNIYRPQPFLKLPEFIWNLKSLVELHLQNLRVTELSEAIGNLTDLSVLDVGCNDIKKLPDALGELEKLEMLIVDGNVSLEELPETIGGLRSLRWLRIKFCRKVERLPSAIERLEKLEWLDATNCVLLGELPDTIGNLTNLRWLQIEDSRVKRLPIAIGRLKKLEWLSATNCKFLEKLPDSIGNLTNLRRLYIERSRVKRLPSAIGRLEKLELLYANGCGLLGELPESIGNLRNLRFLNVSSSGIKKLPAGVGLLQKLEQLDCCFSSLEGKLSGGVWSLSALRELSLYNTKISSLLPADITCCSHLTTLNLRGCPNLRLPSSELKLPSSLVYVEIPLTKAALDNMPSLPKLKRLIFDRCDRTDLVEFPIDLGGLSHKLEKLHFFGFKNYTSLPVKINNLTWLRFLSIGSRKFGFDGEEGLVLDGCEFLKRLPDLPDNLLGIMIYDCPQLSHIDGLAGGLTSLTHLHIKNCPSLDSLPDLSTMTSLYDLNIYKCEKLRKIKGLEALPRGTRLTLLHCPSLEKLPHLSFLKSKLAEFHHKPRLRNWGTENESEESQDEESESESNGPEEESQDEESSRRVTGLRRNHGRKNLTWKVAGQRKRRKARLGYTTFFKLHHRLEVPTSKYCKHTTSRTN